jgi:hypothetical protein
MTYEYLIRWNEAEQMFELLNRANALHVLSSGPEPEGIETLLTFAVGPVVIFPATAT